MPLQIQDNYGLAILRDASLAPPANPAAPKGAVDALRPLARDGHVFFIDGEDPITLSAEILVSQPLPSAIAAMYRTVGGTFLLRVPTGVLHFSGYSAWSSLESSHQISVAPGIYGVTAHAFETQDLTALQAAEIELVGPPAIAHRDRVDRLWFIGCLPTVAFILTLLVPGLRRIWPVVLVLAGAAWIPHLVLVRGQRFRDIEERLRAYQASLPNYILVLHPVVSAEGLTGGFVTTE